QLVVHTTHRRPIVAHATHRPLVPHTTLRRPATREASQNARYAGAGQPPDGTLAPMGVITVTGGTGTLGRHVVAGLIERGDDVLVLSRHTPAITEVPHRSVDLRAGVGLEEAIHGSETIVHCATSPRGDARAAGRLVAAASRAGVRHIVYIS